MFNGSCVALVTPMTPTGDIDESALVELVEWHIKEGTAGIVACGTTGEAATLTPSEQLRVISLVQQVAKKRIPIIAGTGTNATASTIARTQAAKDIGVDACLIVTPYYNRPTQLGLVRHYTEVAKAVNLPILMYNVPSRTSCDMLPETAATLSEIPNIVGLKEATGNMQRLQALQEQCKQGFVFYSGDDPTAYEFIRRGGNGVISITANVAPKLMQKMCLLALAKDELKASALDGTLQALHRTLLIEPNPIPVKWALQHLGKIVDGIRLPLTPLSAEHHDKLKQALQMVGLYARQLGF